MRFAITVLTLLIVLTTTAYCDVEVYFGPNGGFAPMNRNRSIETTNSKQMAPTINNAVKALIDKTQDGGQIKMAMYAFSEKGMLNVLINAAFKRNIRVKLLLDGVAAWTTEIRSDIIKAVKTAARKTKEPVIIIPIMISPLILQTNGRMVF